MRCAATMGRHRAAILLAGVLVVLGGCSSRPEQVAVEGSAKADRLTACVEPTPFIRRNHMELIKHQRDETVHKGIRATNHSLAGCIDCHVRYDAKAQPVPVNQQGQFCFNCHDYAGLSLSCFQCHSPVPHGPQPGGLAQGAWAAPLGAALADGGPTHPPLVDQDKGH